MDRIMNGYGNRIFRNWDLHRALCGIGEYLMKRTSFYALIAGIVAVEALVFWWALEIEDPLPSIIAVLLGLAVVYIGRMYVEEVIEDERTQKIEEKTAFRTLQITWIALFVFGLWMIINSTSDELQPLLRLIIRRNGFELIGIVAGMIIVYVLLLFYYGKKYGE
jgi:uncharacterized membrane protein